MGNQAGLTLLYTLRRELDLEPILVKAMDSEEGYGWTLDFACRVAEEYCRLLVLCLEHQDAHHLIVPSKSVDKFWHLHILDTEKYIEDCQHCFGSILYRSPYLREAEGLRMEYMNTFALYRFVFENAPAARDIWPLPSPAADLPSVYLDIDHDLEDASPSQETLSHRVRNKAEARQWIRENLDLEPILVKAMDAEEDHGWTLDFARRVAEEYRRFLVLCLEHQDAHHLIVPSKPVNKFWHLHILDTRKYMEDCQYCFGFSLHHFPYFGMRGDGDAISLRETYYETLVLYQSAFGMSADAAIWPHSKTALEYWSRGWRTLSRRGEEGGSRFDRSRPKLAPGLSMNSPTKLETPKLMSDAAKVKKKKMVNLSPLLWTNIGLLLLALLLLSFGMESLAGLLLTLFFIIFIPTFLGFMFSGSGGRQGGSYGACSSGGASCGGGGCGGGGGAVAVVAASLL